MFRLLPYLLLLTLPVSNRVQMIHITPGGDYSLTVTNSPHATVLTPGAVTGFHLGQNADANGNRITDVGVGDAATYGRDLTVVDFYGTLPSAYLYSPITYTDTGQILGTAYGANDCIDTPVPVVGALTTMVATASAIPPLLVSAWVSDVWIVTVRTCALEAVSMANKAVSVTVFP